MDYTRTGKHWTINECLQLQREHELLEWSIDEIAIKHKRTPNAIMYKIVKEEFENSDLLSSYLFCKNEEQDEEQEQEQDEKSSNTGSDKEDDLNELKNHVKSLENKMLTIIELIVSQTKNKNAVLYREFF
jgi:septal ring factor EnvC (AmiA/AmiB activator)